MKLKELCDAFCGNLALREVPIGYAIKTPFMGEDGDYLSLYLRRQPNTPGLVRFEDDGGTIASLEADGASLSSETRFAALANLLDQYGAQYNEADVLLHTEYFEEERAPAHFIKFMSLLVRLQDLVNIYKVRQIH